MYGGGRRGIPREEEKGGGRDNNGNNTDSTYSTDGTDDAGIGNLLPPGRI